MKLRRPKQERPGKFCECGNPKTVGVVGCERCRRLEARSAGSSDKQVGYTQRLRHLPDVAAACERFLESRGLKTRSWRSGWR